jgi:hypothetical protein
MDAYMRENNLETVAPQLPPVAPPAPTRKHRPATPPADGAGEEKKAS